MDEMNLEYEETNLDLINDESVDLIVKVKETLFCPNKMKKISWDNLQKNSVNVRLN